MLTWHLPNLTTNAWQTINNRRSTRTPLSRSNLHAPNSSTKTTTLFHHPRINPHAKNHSKLHRISIPFYCVDPWMASGVLCCPNLTLTGDRRSVGTPGVELSSAFVDSWRDWSRSGRVIRVNGGGWSLRKRRSRGVVIVSELAGQYEDSFEDVKSQIMNYFTYKAVRTVMNQLYEMNPTQYRWLYDFVVNNKPGDGKRFLRTLGKERQELAERVMVTRLHLYAKWVKKCDHAEMYKEISDQNLELMRERLMETVIWPSDDTNTEKVG